MAASATQGCHNYLLVTVEPPFVSKTSTMCITHDLGRILFKSVTVCVVLVAVSTRKPCRAVASGVLGGAEHPRAAGAAPVLRMARSTPS